MSENEIEAGLQVPVFFTNDFDVDESGVSYLVTLVYVGGGSFTVQYYKFL
jgi:hypothetical protein